MCEPSTSRIGHDDDLVIAQAFEVERAVAAITDAGADRDDQIPHLGVLQHLIQARLLNVEDLALDRENGLVVAIAALLGGAPGRVTLDDEELGILGVAAGAIGQLAREAAAGERGLAHGLAGAARGLVGAGGIERLVDDALRDARVAVEEAHQTFIRGGGDNAFHLGRKELHLGLGLELGVRVQQRDDSHEAFAHVVAGKSRILWLKECVGLAVLVDRARQRRAKTLQVRASVGIGDCVGEAKNLVGNGIVVLENDVDLDRGAARR